MTNPRKGRWYSKHELDRFCRHLAESGNMSAAADAIGRDVSGFYLRRRRDAEFRQRCDLAIAAFRCGPGPHRDMLIDRGRELRTRGGEWMLVRGGPQRGVQLRRAPPGRLTRAAMELFLRTVAATANLKLAARTVGTTPQAIADRRKRDLHFDEQVREALKQGVANLETQLLDSALRGLAGDVEEEEEEEWEQESGALPDEPGWPTPPVLPPMTAAEAFNLLRKQQEFLSRPKAWKPNRDRQILEEATARLKRLLQRMRLEVESKDLGE